MNRKYLTAPIISVCLLLIFALMLDSNVNLRVYASPGDSYGNDIVWVAVYQGGVLKANFTASGGSARIDAGIQVDFVVYIKFNASLATSQSEAVSYTKVVMNITYNSNFVWQNKELNNTSVSGPSGGFYWLKEVGNWTSNLPQAGATYTCTVKYQGYY